MIMEFELFFLVIPSGVIFGTISLLFDFEHAVKAKHNNADISNMSSTFTTREEGEKMFTAKVPVALETAWGRAGLARREMLRRKSRENAKICAGIGSAKIAAPPARVSPKHRNPTISGSLSFLAIWGHLSGNQSRLAGFGTPISVAGAD